MMRKLISSSVLLMALAGCNTQGQVPYYKFDAHAAFPTTAQKKTAYLDLAPLQQGRLTNADSRRVADFLAAYHRQGEAPISITITAPSIDDPAGRQQASEAAVMLQKQGIPAAQLRLFINESPLHVGPQLAFPIYVVAGRDCGHWTTPVDMDPDGANTDNFGCALQQNVDVMAANPRDLVKPSPSTGRDSERSWLIMENYQAGRAIPGADDIRAGVASPILNIGN